MWRICRTAGYRPQFTLLLAALLLVINWTVTDAQSCALNPTFNYTDVFPFNWNPPANSQFQCLSEGGWVIRGSTCYKLYPTKLSWSDAVVACQSKGSYLAEIDLFNTNLFVGNLVNSATPTITDYWIGLTRTGSISSYDAFWSDGSNVDVVVGNWAAGQPSGGTGTCAYIRNNQASQFPWYLGACNDKRSFVCERPACISGQFQCFNGLCVNSLYTCDGADDCGDYSDEMNCPNLCNQVITSTSGGTIQSANYPSPYSPSRTCFWLLQGSLGSNLQLTFTAFATEAQFDVVDIYFGGSTLLTSKYAGSISGTLSVSNLPTYVSNNNLMLIRFTSNFAQQLQGFQATWKTTFTCNMGSIQGFGYPADINPYNRILNTIESTCQTTCLNDVKCQSFTFITGQCILHSIVWPPVRSSGYNYWVKTCPGTAGISEMQGFPGVGTTLYASSTTSPTPLFSPGYPLPYFTNLKVAWVIQAASSWNLVSIQAMDVNLGAGDTVEIRDGSTSVGSLLHTFVGDGSKNLKFVASTQQYMYIYMSTVSQQRGRGFYFNYYMGCTYLMEASSGVIQSPGYGVNNYPPLVNCQWKIHTTVGVTLKFDPSFNIGGLDKLQIYLNPGPNYDVLANQYVSGFNGLAPPPDPIYASSGYILVTFTSDASGGGPGFKAVFSQDCSLPNLDINTSIANGGTISLTYLSSFAVVCNTGYHFVQEEYGQCPVSQVGATVTLQCLAGGVWSGLRLPSCALVHCGAPPNIENGRLLNATSLYYNGIASYTCFSGFSFTDPSTTQSFCQETGTWSTPSSCQGVTCPPFSPPDNGAFNVQYGDGFSYTSVLQITCNTGYDLTQGLPTVFCQANGTWSSSTSFICSVLHCVVPSVSYAVVTFNGDSTVTVVQFGDLILITCNTGFQLLGTSNTARCNELGQFPDLPSCTNVNECLNSPCSNGGSCTDTVGSFYCTCPPGYQLDSSLVNCIDVDECATSNGWCQQQCTNSVGSYSCSCTDPFLQLFTVNGTNSFYLQGAETGLDNWNVLKINKSCVPIYCPIPTIPFGTTVSAAAPLYYTTVGTTLQVICNIGYLTSDTFAGSETLTCQTDGTWSPTPPTCINASCPALVLPSSLVNPPQNVSPLTSILYNQVVNWQCNVTGRNPVVTSGSQACLWSVGSQSYGLTGSPLECGVIDCGTPSGVAGMDTSTVGTTTVNSMFTFQCMSGFTLNGTSSFGDLNVRCIADPRARWDFGSLICVGPTCSDPGTPPDGTQNAVTYEDGKIVSFACNRAGYRPNPSSVQCGMAPDGSMSWSPAIPAGGVVCADVSPPVFTGCSLGSIAVTVNLYDSVASFAPSVTDNSGLVASLTTTADLTAPFTSDQNIAWTATDSAGNQAICFTNVTVRVQAPPTFTCPASDYVNLTSLIGSTSVVLNASQATASGRATIVSNSIIPSSITVSVDRLWQPQVFRQVARDNYGNRAECSFQRVVIPGQCSDYAMKTPARGSKICNGTSDYNECVVSCPTGYVFYNLKNPSKFICSSSSPTFALSTDPTVTYVPDCMQPNSSTFQQTYQITYTTNSLVPIQNTSPYITAAKALLPTVQTTLQNLCNIQLANSPTVVFNQTVLADTPASFIRLTYSLQLVSSSQSAGITQCGNLISSAFNDLANANTQLISASALKNISPVGAASITVLTTGSSDPTSSSVQTLLNGYSCPVGLGLQSDNGYFYCLSCAPGTQKVGDTCVPCPIGSYQNSVGQTSCIPCPSGSSTYFTGSSSSSQCYPLCERGFASATGLPPCTQCSVSTYWTSPTTCTPCPANSVTSTPGAFNASLCMAQCSAGSYSPTGYMPCQLCPIGYYQNFPGSVTCNQCPISSSTATTGAVGSSQCLTDATALCVSSPCLNGGTCNINSASTNLICNCPAGFTGSYCQTYLDPCASKPCFHNGTCTSNSSIPNTYQCTCPPVRQDNYTATVNTWASGTPINYLTNSPSAYQCQQFCSSYDLCVYAVLITGSSGTACYLYPSGSPLSAQVGSSTFTRFSFIASIYSGSRCEISPNNCALSQCQNQANCQNIQLANSFKCLCLQNSAIGLFSGALCDKLVDVCSSNPCVNGGTCLKLNNIRYKCSCLPGYTGFNCQTQINECDSTPCLYGGTCTDLVNAFSCTCPRGYTGPTCATRPTSICAVYNQPCTNGRCVDYYPTSSYLCACNPGYSSDLYWTSWMSAQNNASLNGGDIETVALLRNMSNIICPEDSAGPVTARCRVKGSLNVFDSSNAPQLLSLPCGPQGLICRNEDQTSGICSNYEIQFQCNAKGQKCYYLNQCTVNPCQNGATCTDKANGYSCTCVPGYTGVNCQQFINYCNSNPCMYNGACTPQVNGYTCNCQPGFAGTNCQSVPNNCLSNTCNVNGTQACNSTLQGYVCQCKPGYTGSSCQTVIDNCFSFPCRHGGVCVNVVNSFQCQCSAGWTGTRCQTVISNKCPANLCVNGGVCVDAVTDFLCRCNANFYGRTCSQGVGVCQIANPCLNGGTCTNSLSGASCSCLQNYGNLRNCECRRDFCSATNNICQNGATCSVLSNGGYQCTCPPGYTGTTCATMINNCAGVNCGTGTCINGRSTYFCACPPGYLGEPCNWAIFRDVDVCLGTNNGVDSKYPFLLSSNAFTIGFWLRYNINGANGEVVTLYSTVSQAVANKVQPLVIFNATTVVITTTSDSNNVYLSYSRAINDGSWHYVTLTMTTSGGQSQAVLYVDTGTSTSATSGSFSNALIAQTNYVLVRLGSVSNSQLFFFTGCVSLVQVWNVAITSNQLNTIYLSKNKDVTDSWYTVGMIFDYGNGLYNPGDHVTHATPSQRSLRPCPPGQSSIINSNGQNVCFGPDKSSPYLVQCPRNVAGQVNTDGYAKISWSGPQFTGATSVISNFVSDSSFPVGIDPVQYVATNAANNYNLCNFDAIASLGTCSGLQAPSGASNPSCSLGDNSLFTRCTVSCPSGMTFLRPLPNILNCWESGTWNTYNPYVNLRLPPCGTLGPVRMRVVFGFTYNLLVNFDTVSSIIQQNLLTALQNWNQLLTAAGGGVCNDGSCSNTNIIVFNKNGLAGVTITLDQTPQIVGSSVTVTTAVIQAVLIEQRFVVPTVPGAASVDPTTFNITTSIQCGANTQVVDNQCVQCPPGTFYNSTAQLCLNCPVGTYQDQTMMSTCISCGAGFTTEKDGCVSSSECFTSCNPGSYYDVTSQACVLCPLAQYQSCSGRSFCQRCPSGKTTSSTGSTSAANCFNDCSSGFELMSNGSCRICPVGTYRAVGFQPSCTACPDGFTTLLTGRTKLSDCNTVVCPAGQYRVDSNPGVCVSCPIGYYRNSSMNNCTACGDLSKWRTDNVGSDSASLCLFYCPAGKFISSTNTCSNCSQGSYKIDGEYYAQSCTPCPANLPITLGTGSTKPEDCRFAACTAGQVVDPTNPTNCIDCPYNTYQPNPVPTTDQCIACPPNTGTVNVASTNFTQCSVQCPSGQEMNPVTRLCQLCARGYYKDNTLSQAAIFSPCVPCPTNIVTPDVGSTSASQCTQGACLPGTFINSQTPTQCDPCPIGTYQDTKWQISCNQCPAGSTTSNTGSVYLSDCNVMTNTRTLLFQFAIQLPFIQDYFNFQSDSYIQLKKQVEFMMTNLLKLRIRSFRGTAQAIAFTPGSIVVTMQAQFNNTDLSALNTLKTVLQTAFASGLWSDPTNTYTSLPVALASYASDSPPVPCTNGNGFNFNTGACEPCPVGTYQLPGLTQVCVSCPAGYSTLQTTTVGTADSSCFLICPVGQESLSRITCQLCRKNFYKSASGAQNCTACNGNLITINSGSASVSQCQAACPAGQYSNVTSPGSDPVCVPCPVGTYQPSTNQLSCFSCPSPYTTAASGSTDASACKDSCSIDASYCQNGGTCNFDASSKTLSCSCTIIYSGDRCGSFSFVLWIIIAAGAVLLAVVIVIIVVLVVRYKKNKAKNEQKKLAEQLKTLKLKNEIQEQESNLQQPETKSILKSQPRNSYGIHTSKAPLQNVAFYNPTFQTDRTSPKGTMYGMLPGYAPSLNYTPTASFLFHEDPDPALYSQGNKSSSNTAGAFFQAN